MQSDVTYKNIYCETASGSVGLYFQVVSKDIIVSIDNTPLPQEIVQILSVYRLLQGDVTLQEVH